MITNISKKKKVLAEACYTPSQCYDSLQVELMMKTKMSMIKQVKDENFYDTYPTSSAV